MTVGSNFLNSLNGRFQAGGIDYFAIYGISHGITASLVSFSIYQGEGDTVVSKDSQLGSGKLTLRDSAEIDASHDNEPAGSIDDPKPLLKFLDYTKPEVTITLPDSKSTTIPEVNTLSINIKGGVSKEYLLIGVPYKQDIRVGRATCSICGKKNPPWGHVNSFDEKRLAKLFSKFKICEVSFVGKTISRTNIVSMILMDLAGNPYGRYQQEEPCIYCNSRLIPPPERNLLQKVLTRLAFYIRDIQRPFLRERGNWIHVLFKKVIA